MLTAHERTCLIITYISKHHYRIEPRNSYSCGLSPEPCAFFTCLSSNFALFRAGTASWPIAAGWLFSNVAISSLEFILKLHVLIYICICILKTRLYNASAPLFYISFFFKAAYYRPCQIARTWATTLPSAKCCLIVFGGSWPLVIGFTGSACF